MNDSKWMIKRGPRFQKHAVAKAMKAIGLKT